MLRNRFYLRNGSSAANAAPNAKWLAQTLGYTTNGLYWIATARGARQVYCDLNTLDANGETGWMLVASWSNAPDWTYTSNSQDATFDETPLNCVSCNFADMSLNQFRVHVSSEIGESEENAIADWYYEWDTRTTWKQVWAPDGGRYRFYLSDLPRAAIKIFNRSYNMKFRYTNSTHIMNGYSDYGLSSLGDRAANYTSPTGVTNAPVAGLCPFWDALNSPGNPFGAYNMGRNANFLAGTGADADGTLAIPIDGSGTTQTGQDIDTNVATKIGRDDGVLWAAATTDKNAAVGSGDTTANNIPLWWWIK